MFPSVDIRPASSVRMGEPILGQGSAAEAPISCETDYDNQSDTIQVVSDLSSTTVSIDPNVPDGRAWLVDSESR